MDEDIGDEEIDEDDESLSDDDDGDEKHLKRVWNLLNPPYTEEDVTKGWYGAIYEHGKKNHLYIGKATRHFR